MDNESPKNSTANAVECDALLAVRLLRIRSLIADKEMVTARANLDLQRGGDWCQDYQEWHRQIDLGIEAEIDALQSAANTVISESTINNSVLAIRDQQERNR